ncbi:MAG: EAL domain-containing protein [Pseudomonadota bacterium]|nr:EAL domain-containing protein [Pseudomonadota bacterium]
MFIVATQPLVAWLVIATGGTKLVWPYLMFVPVIVAGMVFRVPGGALAGLAGGIMLGPWMPLDGDAGVAQQTVNWIARLAFLMLIGAFVGVLAAIMDRTAQAERRLAMTDSTTGFLRVSGLRDQHGAAIRSGPDSRLVIALVLRNYDEILDAFGEAAAGEIASRVFREIAQSLPDDCGALVRVAPDKMALVLPSASRQADMALLRRLLGAPVEVAAGDPPLPAFVHSGIADVAAIELLGPDPFARPIRAARQAIDRSRRVARYDSRLQDRQRENLLLLRDLLADLESGRLTLHFQPKVSFASGAAVGAEALLRWQHREHGNVPPGRFIALAENSLIIHRISQTVISAGLAEIAAWRQDCIPLGLALNLSARDLQQAELIRQLEQAPHLPGGTIDGLTLEITETALIAEWERARRVLRRLRAIGYRIALDDFGTGYATMAMFKQIEVDEVKIDRTFVGDIAASVESRSIVRAMIALCRERGIRTVAEGAEDMETIDMLRDLGCDEVQGFAIARPMPGPDFRSWVAANPLSLGLAG